MFAAARRGLLRGPGPYRGVSALSGGAPKQQSDDNEPKRRSGNDDGDPNKDERKLGPLAQGLLIAGGIVAVAGAGAAYHLYQHPLRIKWTPPVATPPDAAVLPPEERAWVAATAALKALAGDDEDAMRDAMKTLTALSIDDATRPVVLSSGALEAVASVAAYHVAKPGGGREVVDRAVGLLNYFASLDPKHMDEIVEWEGADLLIVLAQYVDTNPNFFTASCADIGQASAAEELSDGLYRAATSAHSLHSAPPAPHPPAPAPAPAPAPVKVPKKVIGEEDAVLVPIVTGLEETAWTAEDLTLVQKVYQLQQDEKAEATAEKKTSRYNPKNILARVWKMDRSELPHASVRVMAALASNAGNRSLIIQRGGIPALRSLVERHLDIARVPQQAARALANLVIDGRDACLAVVSSGFLPLIVEWARQEEDRTLRTHAVRILINMQAVRLGDATTAPIYHDSILLLYPALRRSISATRTPLPTTPTTTRRYRDDGDEDDAEMVAQEGEERGYYGSEPPRGVGMAVQGMMEALSHMIEGDARPLRGGNKPPVSTYRHDREKTSLSALFPEYYEEQRRRETDRPVSAVRTAVVTESAPAVVATTPAEPEQPLQQSQGFDGHILPPQFNEPEPSFHTALPGAAQQRALRELEMSDDTGDHGSTFLPSFIREERARTIAHDASGAGGVKEATSPPAAPPVPVPPPPETKALAAAGDAKKDENVDVDIVLVHGISGSPLGTWRTYSDPGQPKSRIYWPMDWLPQDLAEGRKGRVRVRVISVGYRAAISMWGATVTTPLEERAPALLSELKAARVGENGRSVVWICHSMGGLLAKQIMVDAAGVEKNKHLLAQTRAIIFYSTPHFGSWIPMIAHSFSAFYRPSTELRELRQDSDDLRHLNDRFKRYIGEDHIKVLSFGEELRTAFSKDTYPAITFQIVAKDSAYPGFGEWVPVKADHVDICKPRDRQDAIYSHLILFLRALELQPGVRELPTRVRNKAAKPKRHEHHSPASDSALASTPAVVQPAIAAGASAPSVGAEAPRAAPS